MQISIADAVHFYLSPCLADILVGFGLATLLEFSHVSPDFKFAVAICLGLLIGIGLLTLLIPCQKLPTWVAICNTTFSLVITLALSLNLLSQLCPPNGKNLSLIPVYALLCIPRVPPSGKALLLLAGASLLLAATFLMLPTSRSVRPTGDVGSGWLLAVSFLAGSALQTFGAHSTLESCLMEGQFDERDRRRWRAVAVVCKGLVLTLLGTASNTSLYHFMYERPNTVPFELFLLYGTLLLFACMQTASVWFGQLRELLGTQAKWRLVVRIQHIIYALIVAAAWVYPLQLHALRVLILVVLLGLNVAVTLWG